MKLLFLLPGVPDPPDAGAKIRNLGLLQLAAAEHEVDAIAFGHDSNEGLARLARRAEVVPPPRLRRPPERAAAMVRAHWPDMALRLWSVPFLERLHALLASGRYDAVQAEGLEMARYLWAAVPRDPARGKPWRVYDAHNAEFLLQRRAFELALRTRAASPRRLLGAAYSLVQWKRLERFEQEVVRLSRLTLAVSNHDANQLEALARRDARVEVVPNAIHLERYPYRPPWVDDPPDLLFLGKLDFRPNAEGLRWLLAEVLPRLWQRVPRARLWVVGANPPAWLVAAGQQDERVAVVGPVADERPYLERAALLALPVHVGGGSRLKALVAFASGVPVVSTRLGMEGIDAEPGLDHVQADTPEDWVAALTRLLGDPAERQRLAASGRALVQRRYTWPAIAPTLRQAYSRLERGGG